MQNITRYQSIFNKFLTEYNLDEEPQTLYQPIKYILSLGGKRLRPILTLMTADMFGAKTEEALNAALCVEVFHNFSLIHDDIMDDAPLRRGKPTVHEKWNLNTGILSGDAMLILSYQLLEYYQGDTYKNLNSLFTKTALEVCEGQQYDIDFETRNDVTIDEYIEMITYKTSVLVAAAMKMGAIIAEASAKDQELIYEFGKNLGIAFQIQDDYLDAFGDPETFGKQVGGDIIENKKTYLYLKAFEKENNLIREELFKWFNETDIDKDQKVQKVKELFERSGAVRETKSAIETYTNHAFDCLENLSLGQVYKNALKEFGEQLMQRKV
jgi:geranylgeranyl diphosphate synthase type II